MNMDGKAPDTQGSLTITGLDDYYDNWVYAKGQLSGSRRYFYAMKATSAIYGEAVQIKSGSVTLPVYLMDGGTLTSFYGNGTQTLTVFIHHGKALDSNPKYKVVDITVAFNNGAGRMQLPPK